MAKTDGYVHQGLQPKYQHLKNKDEFNDDLRSAYEGYPTSNLQILIETIIKKNLYKNVKIGVDGI